jgi:hypothetical protein
MRNLTVIPSLLDLFTTIVYIGGEIHKMLIGDFTIKISTTYHHGHKPTVIDLKRTIKQGGGD